MRQDCRAERQTLPVVSRPEAEPPASRPRRGPVLAALGERSSTPAASICRKGLPSQSDPASQLLPATRHLPSALLPFLPPLSSGYLMVRITTGFGLRAENCSSLSRQQVLVHFGQ